MKAFLIFLLISSFTICQADDGDTSRAIGTTTKVLRSTKLGREIEKSAIKKGHLFVRQFVPYSETLIGAIVLVLQPVQYRFNKHNRIVYDYKKQKIEYQFNYEF